MQRGPHAFQTLVHSGHRRDQALYRQLGQDAKFALDQSVRLPNDEIETTELVGDMVLQGLVPIDGKYPRREAIISNVHYGSNLGANLMSQGTLQDEGYQVETDAKHTTVYKLADDGTPHVLFVTTRAPGDLPRIMLAPPPSATPHVALSVTTTSQANLIGKARDTMDNWHRRFGHANFNCFDSPLYTART